MDSFSGSSPLEFISFYLDMSSEEHNEVIPATATGTLIEEEVPQQPEETVVNQTATAIKDAESKQPDPPKDSSSKTGLTPSPSTDESISAYIERQLQSLGCQDTGLAISFLPPTTSAVVDNVLKPATEKASESESIPHVTTGLADKESPEFETGRTTDIASEAEFSVTKADYIQTDTSDNEELLDSSGAETVKQSPFLLTIETESATGSETRKETDQLSSAGLPGVSSPKLFSPTRPLSASARTLINQHFSETNPSILPVGHATVAFNQGQVHSILRAVSTETITSSLHQMKNILEEAIRLGSVPKVPHKDQLNSGSNVSANRLTALDQMGKIATSGLKGTPVEPLVQRMSLSSTHKGLIRSLTSFVPQVLLARLRPWRLGQHLCTKSPVQVSAQLIMSRWPHSPLTKPPLLAHLGNVAVSQDALVR